MKLNIETKFEIGQTVYRLEQGYVKKTEPCQQCLGKPVIQDLNVYVCGNCLGHGEITKSMYVYIASQPYRIKNIRVINNTGDFDYEIEEIGYSYNDEKNYMQESELFGTSEEAQVYADDLNNKRVIFRETQKVKNEN